MSNYERTVIFGIFVASAALLTIGYSDFGYEWGLKKPKFKAGDCIREDLSDEFQKRYNYELVLEVGKSQYNTLWYNDENGQAYAYPTGQNFENVDDSYERVKCREKIEVL